MTTINPDANFDELFGAHVGGADVPVLAMSVAQERIARARDKVANGYVEAAGYRLMVLLLTADKSMEQAEAEQFATLAEGGFEVKTGDQQDKESRGSFHGIVISAGPECYNNPRMSTKGPWCEEGDVILFKRYAGHRIEHPPGSNIWYQFMNDEDVMGVVKE